MFVVLTVPNANRQESHTNLQNSEHDISNVSTSNVQASTSMANASQFITPTNVCYNSGNDNKTDKSSKLRSKRPHELSTIIYDWDGRNVHESNESDIQFQCPPFILKGVDTPPNVKRCNLQSTTSLMASKNAARDASNKENSELPIHIRHAIPKKKMKLSKKSELANIFCRIRNANLEKPMSSLSYSNTTVEYNNGKLFCAIMLSVWLTIIS